MKYGSVTDENFTGLIGSALIRKNSRIVIADEVLYIFMGVSHSFTFSDYIHPDCKDEFLNNLENCENAPVCFISKCRHHSGEYVDVSVILSRDKFNEEELIKIEVFEIPYMVQHYKDFLLRQKAQSWFINNSDKILFNYNAS